MGWQYDKSIDPLNYWGMVYIIENKITGQKYLGKKSFWVRKAGKIHKESDWKDYWGSCKDLLQELSEDLYGEDCYERRILHFCVSPGELSWLELVELVKRDAMTALLSDGTPEYWNGNVSMAFQRKVVNNYQDEKRRGQYMAKIAKQRKDKGL